ncbi:hypothetical protein CR513_21340, partial [Mucuna pruriens]
MDANRHDHAIVNAFHALAQAMEMDWSKDDGAVEFQELIFQDMACIDSQKVTIITFMLAEEVECWWENNYQQLKVKDRAITWENFKGIHNYKGMEFLKLK